MRNKPASSDKLTHTYCFDCLILQIIPVIDLLNGVVVHAKHGLRAHYLPIVSQLTSSHQPLTVALALLELYPFSTLYIADINAIQGQGDNQAAIEAIQQTHPNTQIWLDNGIRQVNARSLHRRGNGRPVIGSENIANLQDYRAISYACESKHVLSLDYAATNALGINELHNSARFWPDNTICMTLNKVGSVNGVDAERLQELMRLNNTRKSPSNLFAAGGVRDINDCLMLKSKQISGVLVASALHNGSILRADIEQLIA